MPAASDDWCATLPENGVGVGPTQFHPSPSPAVPAPAGTESSTHTLSVPPVVLPAWSQVTRPPESVNAIPLTTCPSSPTDAAGTVSFTHCPAAGSAPMNWRLVVPLVPATM